MKNHIFKIFVLGITLLLLSSKVEGNNLAALIKAGDAYMAKRNFAKAAIEYQKAYKLDSKNGNLLHKLGKVYVQLKELGAAKVYFQSALQTNLHPSSKVICYQDLISIYTRVFDFVNMEATVNFALKDPSMAKFQKRLIMFRVSQYKTFVSAFTSQKKYAQATKLLEANKDVFGPTQYQQFLSRINIAKVQNFIREKKFQDAEKLLRNLLGDNLKTSMVGNLYYSSLITVLLQQKKISQAEKLLNVFSAKDRLKGSVAVSFAEFYGAKKEFAKAIDVLSKVKDKENANEKRLRYSRMCDYALRNNDGKLALAYYQKARAAVNGKWRLPAYEHRIKLLHPAAKF